MNLLSLIVSKVYISFFIDNPLIQTYDSNKCMNEASTRDKLLDSAELLFSQKGVDATSLREITAHAEVNLASVNYHFRSKEELMWSVYERRFKTISDERVARLDRLEQINSSPELEDVLDAFFRPVIEATHMPDGSIASFMPLFGRMYLERPDLRSRIFDQLIQPMAARYITAFSRCLPHLTQIEVILRMQFVVGSMLHMLVAHQLVEKFLDRSVTGPIERAIGELVTFAAAGFRAPVYSEK